MQLRYGRKSTIVYVQLHFLYLTGEMGYKVAQSGGMYTFIEKLLCILMNLNEEAGDFIVRTGLTK